MMQRRQKTTKTNKARKNESENQKREKNAIIEKVKACVRQKTVCSLIFVQNRKIQDKKITNLSEESQCVRMEK